MRVRGRAVAASVVLAHRFSHAAQHSMPDDGRLARRPTTAVGDDDDRNKPRTPLPLHPVQRNRRLRASVRRRTAVLRKRSCHRSLTCVLSVGRNGLLSQRRPAREA